jgi:hypothetical protein
MSQKTRVERSSAVLVSRVVDFVHLDLNSSPRLDVWVDRIFLYLFQNLTVLSFNRQSRDLPP